MKNLTLHSRPGEHVAYSGTLPLCEPQPTEIDLVQTLGKKGINIKDFRCLYSRGSGFVCVSLWEKKS